MLFHPPNYWHSSCHLPKLKSVVIFGLSVLFIQVLLVLSPQCYCQLSTPFHFHKTHPVSQGPSFSIMFYCCSAPNEFYDLHLVHRAARVTSSSELGSGRSGSVISAWCRNVQSPLYTRLFAWHCMLPFQVPTSLSQHIIDECPPLFILTVLFTPNMTPCFLLAVVALHTTYVFQIFKNLQSRSLLLSSPTSKSKPFSNTTYSPVPLFNPFYQK